MSDTENLSVAMVGAGPIGLAAAAHLIERRLAVKVYEAGPTIASAILDWAHVRTFSPWSCSVDAVARRILERHGWQPPEAAHLPTDAELVRASCS